VHVDEDDGDVLVAGLAGIWLGASVSAPNKRRGAAAAREGTMGIGEQPYHLVNALPSLERLRTVASTRFLVRAALPVDLPPAMDGICRCCCLVGGWRLEIEREERSGREGRGDAIRSDPEGD
jgi:hypothetical protein